MGRHEDPLAADPVADDAEREQQARETIVYELIGPFPVRTGWRRGPPLAAGLAIVFSATLSTVLSMTMASRPTTTTPRMTPSPALNRLSIHEPLQGLGSVTRDRSK